MRQTVSKERETEPEARQALDVGKHGEAAGRGADFEQEKLGIQTNKIERKRQVLGTHGTWTLATLKIRPR
jgi:hypothetical protein